MTAAPRPFRLQGINGPQDCELWPDGRITVRINGETLTNALPFEAMRDMGWTEDRIEWDTAPAAENPRAPEPEPAQDDFFPQLLEASVAESPAARYRRIHSVPDINGYAPSSTAVAVAELLRATPGAAS
jgi:hypothetical protein